jgi:hypothetical protein
MTLRELINLVRFKLDEQSLKTVEAKVSSVATSLGSFGTKMSLMFTAPMAALSAYSIKTASDAKETQNKFNQVFGDLNEEANTFAGVFGKSVGRFKTDIQTGMSAFQSMFVGLSYGNDEALTLSKRMQTLAVDFGSFNNLTDQESNQRFLSALSGSSEVLDMFGINTKQAAIEQELLNMGLNKTVNSATEAEKVMARINIIEKAMTRQGAVGDATRTLGEFANKSRSFMSAIKGVVDFIGNKLLPIASKLMDVGFAVIEWFQNLSDGTKNVLMIITAIIAAIGPLAIGLAGLLGLVKALLMFNTFIGGLAGLKAAGLLLLQPQFLLIAAAIMLAVVALALFIEDIQAWVSGGDSLTGKLLGPWEAWAAGIKEMFSLLTTDFDLFVKVLATSLSDGLQEMSNKLEESTFGKIMKWVSGIKIAELAGTGLGTLYGNFMPNETKQRVELTNALFEGERRRQAKNTNVNVNSTISMQVPAGTSEEQKTFIEKQAKLAVKQSFTTELERLLDNEVIN